MARLTILVALLAGGCSFSTTASTPDRCEPWATCPEALWLKRVVEAGGFQIVGDTGAALIAYGENRNFYVWTTRAGRETNLDLRGGPVRRHWDAQGYRFWIEAGPTSTSIAPDGEELERVMRASLRIPPPK